MFLILNHICPNICINQDLGELKDNFRSKIDSKKKKILIDINKKNLYKKTNNQFITNNNKFKRLTYVNKD